jgi:DNA-3-methyladenine glycosylase I
VPQFRAPFLEIVVPNRCSWPGNDKDYIRYHDEEWGIPVTEDRRLFECLCLEGQQAGLSWITVLRKRDRYRKCFFNFKIKRCAQLTDEYVDALLLDEGLIRSRPKLLSIRLNARKTLAIQSEFGSFHKYIWGFILGSTAKTIFEDQSEIPTATATSQQMAADLKKRGFKFVGPKICYAYMQAIGMVNDHITSCFRFKELHDEKANR